ncbi:hypothetical protein AXF42_Ash014691 [Apostasia shenzhenica]|uniref:TOD1/MUCI70 glycosyltransferase-like domain-containing protein n=1 Tax=Apostasia shenzhenica TaxID=1088818 RepID=A0A2I0AKD5_9ASPA|nr:hypothetical protein AXF42_Ash014691 [Apostasia shenzhenica]
MEGDSLHSLSTRLTRRTDGSSHILRHTQDSQGSFFSLGKASRDPMKMVCQRGCVRLFLVSTIAWMMLILTALLFHVWSCRSEISFFATLCRKDSKVLVILDTRGLSPKLQHRCSIPLADDPDAIEIPGRTLDILPKNLSYITVDTESLTLFGGHQSWSDRENSFKLNETMKVHCGFIENGGAEMDNVDANYAKKCKFVVASGIFDGYDTPHQPTNISRRSQKLFCFLMVVDEVSLDFIKQNVSVRVDKNGGNWVGIWRLVTLRNTPYDEPRRNGKVPKILTQRLFPQAQYSIWIDGKMELIVDPLLILERYLWRGKHTFAIARHKHHKSIYEEADAIKRRKRYARPLVDLHMKIYVYEGMEPWSLKKRTFSDVPEGAVIIREHTAINNLFSCLWFNEVNLFTPRDQVSFGYVVYRLGDAFKFHMFPNCEYNSLFILHKHTREHSSAVEWVKNMSEFKGKKSSELRETRGGLGLWRPYPADLSSVRLPEVSRSSPAG